MSRSQSKTRKRQTILRGGQQARSEAVRECAEEVQNTIKEYGKIAQNRVKDFTGDVRKNFSADEGTSGFNTWKSRFVNLWKSGLSGKITLTGIALALLLAGMFIFGGASEKNVAKGSSVRMVKIEETTEGAHTKEGMTDNFSSVDKGVAIKGIYMGMGEQECVTCLKRLASRYGYEYSATGHLHLLREPSEEKEQGEGNVVMRVVLNEEGIAEGAVFYEESINKMFNVKDMTLEQFVQALCDNYSIPTMKYSTQQDPYVKALVTVMYSYEDAAGRSVTVKKTTMGGSFGELAALMGGKSEAGVMELEMKYTPRSFD